MQPSPRATLQTADRALQMLQLFRRPQDSFTVAELARRLHIHRSTASRLVSTLCARGFLVPGLGERLTLGPEIGRLGELAEPGQGLAEVAREVIERLAAATGEAATLAVAAAGEVLTVAEASGPHFVASRDWMGVRTPPHCSADGKVLLAFGALALPGGELAARTARTVRDREVLRGELERARERGFAVARGELEEGLHGIAAPVWRAEVCVAALCLSGPEYRLRGSFEEELAGPLLLASEELGRRLSGTAT